MHQISGSPGLAGSCKGSKQSSVECCSGYLSSLGSSTASVSCAIFPPRVSPSSSPCSRCAAEPPDQQAPKAEERPKGPVKRKERGRKDQRLSHLDTPLKIRPATPRGDRWRADNGPPGRGSLTSCPGRRALPEAAQKAVWNNTREASRRQLGRPPRMPF